MSDIIDFNELKNKASDKDVDKLEQYMYNLYFSMSQGDLNIGEFTRNIKNYMEENNISEEKFLNIQKKLMGRYGMDFKDLEEQMKSMGMDMSALGIDMNPKNYEKARKTMSFYEKYNNKVTVQPMSKYTIKNDVNNIEILLDNDLVILRSNDKINLQDNELNEFLCSYKKCIENDTLRISICDSIYEY